MTRRTKLQILFILGLIALSVLSADAGEIRLRTAHVARSAVVALGDVAEFAGLPPADVAEIESLPLFPAPRSGLSRRVTAQDVRETMSLYGLSVPTVRISGECRVEGAAVPATSHDAEVVAASLTVEAEADHTLAAITERIAVDLNDYLQAKDRLRTEWRVTPLLTSEQAADIASFERPEVAGGHAPWTGRQVFSVRDSAAADGKPVTIKADVVRVARAVAARRNLGQGDIVTSEDVEVVEVNPLSLSTTSILNLEDALGKQLTRAIPAGQMLQGSMLEKPLLVKRGELITVYSLAAGVQVKATAKSLADGAAGDVILLESEETGKRFQARVTAPQEAMVFVDTPRVR